MQNVLKWNPVKLDLNLKKKRSVDRTYQKYALCAFLTPNYELHKVVEENVKGFSSGARGSNINELAGYAKSTFLSVGRCK